MSSSEPWRSSGPVSSLDEAPQRLPSKRRIPDWLRAWWPALIWAVLIFGASTDALSAEHTGRFLEPLLYWLFPGISEDNIILVHEFIRKLAHFAEYSVFFLLVLRGIRRGRSGWNWSWAWIAWGIVAVYSISDEFHQVFVPSRGASIWDSILDSISALATLLFIYFVYRRYHSRTATKRHS